VSEAYLLRIAKEKVRVCPSVTAITYNCVGGFGKLIPFLFSWFEFEDEYDPIYRFKMAAVQSL